MGEDEDEAEATIVIPVGRAIRDTLWIAALRYITGDRRGYRKSLDRALDLIRL